MSKGGYDDDEMVLPLPPELSGNDKEVVGVGMMDDLRPASSAQMSTGTHKTARGFDDDDEEDDGFHSSLPPPPPPSRRRSSTAKTLKWGASVRNILATRILKNSGARDYPDDAADVASHVATAGKRTLAAGGAPSEGARVAPGVKPMANATTPTSKNKKWGLGLRGNSNGGGGGKGGPAAGGGGGPRGGVGGGAGGGNAAPNGRGTQSGRGPHSGTPSANNGANVNNSDRNNGSTHSSVPHPAASPWHRFMSLVCICLCCCMCNPLNPASKKRTLQRLLGIVQSRLWKYIIFSFTVILLFGSQFQELFFPPSLDVVFDGIFSCAFFFLFVDILLRCITIPSYFHLSLCGRDLRFDDGLEDGPETSSHAPGASGNGGGASGAGSGGDGGGNGGKDGDGGEGGGGGGGTSSAAAAAAAAAQQNGGLFGCFGSNVKVGSFMFWCDIISTLTLLYDISYINVNLKRAEKVDILLNGDGLPTAGMDEVNDNRPIELQWEVLIAIARTARVARFIRASDVVKNSSKINWYLIARYLDPFYWLSKLFCCTRLRNACHRVHSDETVADGDGAESLIGGDTVGVGGVGVAGVGGGVVVGGRLVGDGTTGTVVGSVGSGSSAKAAARELKRRHSLNQSLRGTDVAAAAAAAKVAEDDAGGSKGGIVRSVLGLLGFRSRGEEERRRRQDAATKIQRAWRSSTGRDRHGSSSTSTGARRSFPSRQSANFMRSPTSSSRKNKASIIKQTIGRPITSVRSTTSQSRRKSESHVGGAMRELTGQRVALGIMIALVLTVLFTYQEDDATNTSTMIVLHSQTRVDSFASVAIEAAKTSSISNLFKYLSGLEGQDESDFKEWQYEDNLDLRQREILRITVTGADRRQTVGYFNNRHVARDNALVELVSSIFIIIIWFFGVTAFAGPVMTLVVIPIERMIRLLTMLMLDPLGYQSSTRYQKFVKEEDDFTKNTRWTKDVLKGMETSFLMSTILRIGSLMKVGFGSAGVEIIRKNLETGQRKDILFLNTQGATVSCIFLFCDIRQFTDATECLQEEVFVFTNKIAAVVHSYCNAYGGSANKNIGDAFLVSWLLDAGSAPSSATERENSFFEPFSGTFARRTGTGGSNGFSSAGFNSHQLVAKNNQADKALLSVVKICMALQHDSYFLESMSEAARDRLKAKLARRVGPVVQMGFGLHAGRAVQGAIGSQRKLDATYVAESVEMAETLESTTKRYNVRVLMSDAFHRLLHPSNRRRCRKIDQIMISSDEDDDNSDPGIMETGDKMELFTFDMNIDALWSDGDGTEQDTAGNSLRPLGATRDIPGSKRELLKRPMEFTTKSKRNVTTGDLNTSGAGVVVGGAGGVGVGAGGAGGGVGGGIAKPKQGMRRRVSVGGFLASSIKHSAVDLASDTSIGGATRSDNGTLAGGESTGAPPTGATGALPGGAGVDGVGTGGAGSGAGAGTTTGATAGVGGVNDSGVGSPGGNPSDRPAPMTHKPKPELNLPTGPLRYDPMVWVNDDMRAIRALYSDGLFFQKFNSGLQSYYARDWEHARQCFKTIPKEIKEDGPSKYFLDIIEKHNCIPPRNFTGYGTV